MDEIYLKMWKLAGPYYEKGRFYDVAHIEWMMEEADKIADLEKLNKRLLLPIVILHDIGYSTTKQKNPNIKEKEVKITHMKEGAKIAKTILEEIDYDKELTEKIVYYISVHDNWILGDDSPFKECKEMAVFNDLEFTWVAVIPGVFKAMAESMKMTPKEFYEFLSKDEKLDRRPFCCDYTKKMYLKTMENIKEAI